MNPPTLADVPCLNAARRRFELKSVVGHHCDVWQVAIRRARRRRPDDIVVKKYRGICRYPELRVLDKDYRRLKASLEDIVPNTVFVAIRTADGPGAIAVSHAVVPWFNLANPINESEAVPLLRKLPKARNQLMRFCHAARKWACETPGRIIDLYGLDNLVLNTDRELRYLDSFHVYFHTDMTHFLDAEDQHLSHKMEISVRRCDYLEHLLRQVRREAR